MRRPVARTRRKAVERGVFVSGRHRFAHSLQPGVTEAGSVRVDGGKLIVVADHHRYIVLAREVDETFVAETLVARFKRVA